MEYKCDLCGRKIARNRYLVRIASYAAYDGLEIGILDLTRNFRKEMRDLLGKIKKTSKRKLEKDICAGFEFSLCKKCRDSYIRDPLGKKRFKSIR